MEIFGNTLSRVFEQGSIVRCISRMYLTIFRGCGCTCHELFSFVFLFGFKIRSEVHLNWDHFYADLI